LGKVRLPDLNLPHLNVFVTIYSQDLISRLQQLRLKIFDSHRDVIVGTRRQAASVNVIESRCKKVIAVFSPSFVNSKENVFLAKVSNYVIIL
jgi:hypothetical protein